MPTISPEFIERYQLEYEKNPNSRIFAPLAEAYRQMGLLDEALRVCTRGVQTHPDFAGGHVAYGKILVDRDEKEKAMAQFERAVELSPDNLLAHTLLGDTLLELRKPKEALKAFKMVLFLNPNDERALRNVKKWEFLSADDYEAEAFEMRPVFGGDVTLPPMLHPESGHAAPISESTAPPHLAREIERALSLADAFTVRGDFERAHNILEDARAHLGTVVEIEKRISLLARRARANAPPPDDEERARRVEKLQLFLQRISVRRTDD